MDERIKPTRSGLFAIELLIAVGVFSMCAAICVGLFVRSEVISQDSADLNRAVAEARSAAECFKAAGGDLQRTAELLSGKDGGTLFVDENTLSVDFDGNWQAPRSEEDVTFALTIASNQTADGGDPGYAGALLEVKRYTRTGNEAVGESILLWDIAALEVAS